MPRYYFGDAEPELLKCTLVGFGDASKDAYAANVYLARQAEEWNETSLVASKTRVALIKKITIPRVELLASVILSRLTATVCRALESVIQIEDYYCWTDSKTAYYWIKNGKEHKHLFKTVLTRCCKTQIQTSGFMFLELIIEQISGQEGHYLRRLKIMTFGGMGLAGYDSPRTTGLPNCHLLLRLQRKENLN